MILPNLITIARLLAVPLAVALISEGALAWAFWLFLAAGASDAVDGFIAKRFNAETELGRYLDPIADKTLLVAVYVTLAVHELLPSWLVILVVSRDVLIVGGVLLSMMLGLSHRVRPSAASKVNTAAQIVLATVVLGVEGGVLPAMVPVAPLVYIVAASTLVSGAGYVFDWLREAFAEEDRTGGAK